MKQPGILVLNAGSSSFKFLFFVERHDGLVPVVRGPIHGEKSIMISWAPLTKEVKPFV